MTDQVRNKYNTLTPAEAKRIIGSRQPLRTASVLRKPRAPPIIVTNLDNELEKQLSQLTLCETFNGCNSLTRQVSMRAGSICTTTTTTTASDSRRHMSNHGPQQQHQRQGALASRLSLYSTASTKSSSTAYQQQQRGGQPQQQHHSQVYQISPHESFTNLSLRSCSRDMPDCASSSVGGGYDPTYRFQTMSVDLSNPIAQRAQQQMTILTTHHNRAYDTMRGRARYAPQRSNTLNYRFSDDSFASAKSDLSAKSSSVTPTRFDPISASVRQPAPPPQQQHLLEPSRSASKVSLSSSTYKVFQSPFANFKKLFRGIQKPFANSDSQQTSRVPTASKKERQAPIATPLQYKQQQQQQQQQQFGRSSKDFSLSDSTISDHHLSFTNSKSQSPPACAPPPPPPGELKSMSYLESSINYSNYDEFTRSRNERLMLTRPNSMTSGDTAQVLPLPPPPLPATNPPIKQQFVVPQTSSQVSQKQSPSLENQQTYDTVANDENDASNWQLTSLPVHYERNLTTVMEEAKQVTCEMQAAANPTRPVDTATMSAEEIYQRLKPPRSFDDPNSQQQQQHQQVACEPSESCERAQSVASSHSPALSSAGESVLEFHRQQPATPYRFSFAQAQPDPDQTSLGKSLGLPPRAPPMGTATQLSGVNNISNTSEIQRQDNNSSSSGNSSNCSSQINGINHCDQQQQQQQQQRLRNPTDSSTPNSHYKSPAEVAVSDAIDKLSSYSMTSDSGGGYGAVSGLSNDADATILSESSTLLGDTSRCGGGSSFYGQKCAELERTVATLKNKLIGKEKELTDMQLSQLNNDYTIERLQKQVGKLERENAQLKTMVAAATATATTRTAGNDGANNANTRGRIHA